MRATTQNQSLPFRRVSIDEIMTSCVCEAKSYLIHQLKQVPGRAQATSMTLSAARELVIEGLPTGRFPGRSKIEQVLRRALKNIDYEDKDKHFEKLLDLLESIGNVMALFELKIIGGAIPVEIAYDGIIVTGVCDGVVEDTKRGYRHPLVIDMSLTRYEPQYNPILYRCDVVSSFYNAERAGVSPCVVTHKTRWFYQHTYYHPYLYTSISERAKMLLDNYSPFRFGWWCSGCEFRGSCFKLIE